MIPFVVGAMLLQAASAKSAPLAVPFAVGETLEYSGKYIIGTPGDATMRLVSIDTVRGVPEWHFALTLDVHAIGYTGHTHMDSWTGANDFISRRFIHYVKDNGKVWADDDFQIHADSGFYRNRTDTVTKVTPRMPLDDLAFIYFLRTMEFKKDSVYRIPRYFRNEHNPVEITVLGHDTVDMPDGSRRSCWLLHPVVDEPGGLFARSKDARLWITDDGVRLPVKIQSDLFLGTHLTLKLKSMPKRQ